MALSCFYAWQAKNKKKDKKMYERADGGTDRQTTEGQIADMGPFNPL